MEQQCLVPLYYRGDLIDERLRVDMLVDERLIIELKAVEAITPLYKAQLLTYLKLAEKPKGLLINFNTVTIKAGIVSMVTEAYANLDD